MYKQYELDELKKLHEVQKEILNEFSDFCEKWDLKYFLVFGTLLGAIRHGGFIPWDDDIDVGMERKEYERFLELAQDHLDSNYEILTPLLNKNYCSSVVHLQKKGTKFVSEYAKNMKCSLGINIDIFIYDHVIDDDKLKRKQMKRTYFYGRLLYLRGSGHPEIMIEGLVGKIAKIVCFLVHCGLVLFGVSPAFLYNKLVKWSSMYNDIDSDYMTCYEDATPWNNIVDKKNLYPLKKIQFEDLFVYAPNNTHEILEITYGDYMQLPPKEMRINHCPIILDFGDEDE